MIENPKPQAQETDAEAEEAKKTPWWKRLSVVITGITAFIGALTGFLAIIVPLMYTPSKAGPDHEPTPPPVVVMQPVYGATPLSAEQRLKGKNRTINATVTTPAGLYLRSGPNEKTNALIKLEQNAKLRVSKCRATVFIGDVEGEWCQATYKDEEGNSHGGWVFNAYLIEDAES